MAKSKDMTGPGLLFLGSLVFLYVVYNWAASPGFAASGWAATFGSFWLPIFGGLAAAGTISILLTSLVGLAGWANKDISMWAHKATFFTSVALFALTVGGWTFWLVALGLILAFFGAGKMMM